MLQLRSLAALAASIPLAGMPQGQAPTAGGAADAIQIEARVVDRLGAPVTNLTADDFEITVEGRRRPVLSAEYQHESAAQKSSVVVVADRENLRMATSRATLDGAAEFIERLPPSHAVGFLILPSAKPTVEIGSDRAAGIAALRRTLGTYQPGAAWTGELALRSALHLVIGRISAMPGRRSVVYLGDRLDYTVSTADLAQRASLSSVVFYVVAADVSVMPDDTRSNLAVNEAERDGLLSLAAASGGALLRRIAGAETVFDRLARELSGQYVLSFAADASGDLGRHTIKVAVKRSGLSVRSRREFVR
jgi:VWFA-related protein